MQNLDMTTELLSIAEAALKLRVSERTVARLIADGQAIVGNVSHGGQGAGKN